MLLGDPALAAFPPSLTLLVNCLSDRNGKHCLDPSGVALPCAQENKDISSFGGPVLYGQVQIPSLDLARERKGCVDVGGVNPQVDSPQLSLPGKWGARE